MIILIARSTNNKWYGCRGAGVARRQLPVFYCSVTWVITFTLTAHTNPGPAAQHQPGSAFFSHLQMVRNGCNGYEAATLLRYCDVLSCCDWLWNQCVSLGNVCTPCSYCCFLITAVCCCCCGVVAAGVVFVRVNNCCKVSPPRVSRVMGTFIAAFINLHITITTAGRPMCHVISAEKEEIIGLPEKKQTCWCKTILVLIPLN